MLNYIVRLSLDKLILAEQNLWLIYKHITIVNDNSSVISEWHSSLIDNTRVVIYDRNLLIEAAGQSFQL